MDAQKYTETVKKYSSMVYRIAFHDCRNRADAEDIMQNVFLRLYRSKDAPQEEEHIRHWLVQVTIRESKRLFSRPFKKREDLLWEIRPSKSSIAKWPEVLKEERENDVLEKVLELPRKYRTVIYLYYYEEYSVKEIGVLLGKKESTIQTQLQRARKKLEISIKEAGNYEGAV